MSKLFVCCLNRNCNLLISMIAVKSLPGKNIPAAWNYWHPYKAPFSTLSMPFIKRSLMLILT